VETEAEVEEASEAEETEEEEEADSAEAVDSVVGEVVVVVVVSVRRDHRRRLWKPVVFYTTRKNMSSSNGKLLIRYRILMRGYIWKIKKRLAKSMKSSVRLRKFILPLNSTTASRAIPSDQTMPFISAQTNYWHWNDLPILAVVDKPVADVVEAVRDGAAVEEADLAVADVEEEEMVAVVLPVVVVEGEVDLAAGDLPAEVVAGDSGVEVVVEEEEGDFNS
jgi:hypothetical protein